jgi:hypothetical protein
VKQVQKGPKVFSVCIYLYKYKHICLFINICVYIYAYLCVYIYMCIHIFIQSYTIQYNVNSHDNFMQKYAIQCSLHWTPNKTCNKPHSLVHMSKRQFHLTFLLNNAVLWMYIFCNTLDTNNMYLG